MIENNFYSHEFHGDYELVSIGRLELEEGGVIPDCQLAVTTWGELNEARDNAILITTWYSGTHQIWRDVYVGAEHALNSERYFVVAINQIGNGLSVSPHNADGVNAGLSMSQFPKLRIGDDVVAQERLLREHFGIEAFLDGFLEPYFLALDPYDLLTMAWKWQRGDLARHTGGDLAAALGWITARTFVIPIDEDMFFPPRDCRAEQELIPGSELRVVEDLLGHLGLFGVSPTYMPQIDRYLGELLATEV
jgi:homoserine acetyltransferase